MVAVLLSGRSGTSETNQGAGMIAADMPDQARQRRSPARFLAPLALIAIIAGIYLIVHNALVTHHPRAGTQQGDTTSTPRHSVTTRTTPAKARTHASTARSYVVRPGDSMDAISSSTGVPLQTLEALNPGVSSNALRVGQRLKLRR